MSLKSSRRVGWGAGVVGSGCEDQRSEDLTFNNTPPTDSNKGRRSCYIGVAVLFFCLFCVCTSASSDDTDQVSDSS